MNGWAWLRARFSCKGRASRREFWLTIPIAFLCAGLGLVLTLVLSIAVAQIHPAAGAYLPTIFVPLVLLDIMLYLWLGIAVSIRRTHDLGHSYRKSFGFGVNSHGVFKRGTIGPNQYGPDPLRKDDAV